jgi:hypothetical protein
MKHKYEREIYACSEIIKIQYWFFCFIKCATFLNKKLCCLLQCIVYLHCLCLNTRRCCINSIDGFLTFFCCCKFGVFRFFDSIKSAFNLWDLLWRWLALWSNGQRSWLQTQKPRVEFPVLPDFLHRSGSGTGSTQLREDTWGATWKKHSGSGLENWD